MKSNQLPDNHKNREVKGTLAFDSPSAYALINRTLKPLEIPLIIECYELCTRNGGATEWPVMREPGASFNSRPARILEILLGTVRDPSATLLAGALISLVIDSPSFFEKEGTPGLALARESHTLTKESSPEAHSIALARLVDDLRHLHMTVLSPSERATILTHAVEVAALSAPSRLSDMVRAAVTRYQRYRETPKDAPAC